MIRSCLFIPANNPGMMQNADLFGADAIIFDLEDAVSLEEKSSARTLLARYLSTFPLKAKVIVRINNNPCFFEEDLEAIISDRIDAVLLPKAAPGDLAETKMVLTRLEKDRGMAKKIALIPLIESAAAVLEAEEILSRPRVSGVLLGAEDLTADMETPRTKAGLEILYPRMRVALIARAYRIFAIDTPFTDVDDEEGLAKDAETAFSLGMSAKAAIHPRQIAVINKVFSPSAEQISWAVRVLDKSAVMKGAFNLDGKMIDKPVINRAAGIIEKAKRYGLL